MWEAGGHDASVGLGRDTQNKPVPTLPSNVMVKYNIRGLWGHCAAEQRQRRTFVTSLGRGWRGRALLRSGQSFSAATALVEMRAAQTLLTPWKQTESVWNGPREDLSDCNFHMHTENSSGDAWGLMGVLYKEVEKWEKYSQVSWASAWLRRKLRGRLCWSRKNHHVLCWDW